MLKICEEYGIEYDVIYNATKTVCIYFSGRKYYSRDPPDVFLNGSRLSWVKTVKHLSNNCLMEFM